MEISSTTTVQVDLIKNWQIAWPRLENDKFIMTIGSTCPLEHAARIAYRELTRWLVSDFGFDEVEAYFLPTRAGCVRLGNMVDSKYTLGASIREAIEETTPSAVICLGLWPGAPMRVGLDDYTALRAEIDECPPF